MARGAQLITIYWRDIPAQVNAKTRSAKHQVLLKPRFQKAIDRAAMVADITTASDYVNEWRQVAEPLAATDVAAIEAAAETAAAALDEAFPLERLDELVAAGGFDLTATANTATANTATAADQTVSPDESNDPAPNDPGAPA
jgi:DNA-binding transcriptional regulator YdaS (Cro superfamily)